MWGVPCQDICRPCKKQAPSFALNPIIVALVFLQQSFVWLGKGGMGRLPWATFLFNFFFFKGNFNENFYFWNWDGMRCSDVVSCILLFLPPCSCLSQDSFPTAAYLQLLLCVSSGGCFELFQNPCVTPENPPSLSSWGLHPQLSKLAKHVLRAGFSVVMQVFSLQKFHPANGCACVSSHGSLFKCLHSSGLVWGS